MQLYSKNFNVENDLSGSSKQGIWLIEMTHHQKLPLQSISRSFQIIIKCSISIRKTFPVDILKR